MSKKPYVYRYTLMDELMASATEPLPPSRSRHQLTRMFEGLAAIERAPNPTKDDWRACSDAVNLLESLVIMGVAQDENGLLQDAIKALATAGTRQQTTGAAIRLDAVGIQAVRATLEDYAALVDVLPARTMIKAHRRTERRIYNILAGKPAPHDVKIVSV